MLDAPPQADWQDLLDLALAEDIGEGDLTSRIVIEAEREGRGRVEAREPLIVCGLAIADAVFRQVDPGLAIELGPQVKDGSRLGPGDVLMRVRGRYASILTAERTALNFLGRLCGVAGQTRRLVDSIAGLPSALVDTRKTPPAGARSRSTPSRSAVASTIATASTTRCS